MHLAVTLLALGADGLAERIEADMATADRFCERIEAHDRLELRAAHTTGVVNWRVTGHDPRAIQRHRRGAWVSTTTVAGQAWLRSVAANPNADPDHVADAVLAAAR